MTTRTAIDPDPKGSFNVGGGQMVPLILKYMIVFKLAFDMPPLLYVVGTRHGIAAMLLLAGWTALGCWAIWMLLRTTTKETA